MIGNYIKVAGRNLRRNKLYVVINTLGMGIALACCMAAYLLMAFNIEFNKYFSADIESKNLFKVVHHLEHSNGEPYRKLSIPFAMAPRAAGEVSSIKEFVRYCSADGYITLGDNVFSDRIYFADESLFSMFDFRLTAGSHKNFSNLQSVFLSEKFAKKYFGAEDPLGKVLTVGVNNKTLEVSVGGVFSKIPLNSTFIPDALLRIENYSNVYDLGHDNWDLPQQASVVFELEKNADPKTVAAQFQKYNVRLNNEENAVRSVSFELMPFNRQISPNDVQGSYFRLWIPSKALVIFSTLAGIILLVACFNLTNTTLAMTVKRMKEIGVRKVVGSSRLQIALQFFMEVALTVMLSIAAGLLMARVIVPEFSAMWGLEYGLMDLDGLNLLAALIIVLFVCALLGGTYPALLNSRYSPVTLFRKPKAQGATPLTRILLVIQFSLSIVVLVAGVVFIQNDTFQQSVSFGYDKEKIFTVSVEGWKEYEVLRNAVRDNPQIETVAAATTSFGDFASSPMSVRVDTAHVAAKMYKTGSNYFSAVGLELVSGRDFFENQARDSLSIIVDGNFVKKSALKQPLGSKVKYENKDYTIIGIVQNHIDGLLDKRTRDEDYLYMFSNPGEYRFMVVRVASPENIVSAQTYVGEQWKTLFPGRPFQSKLQEDVLYEGVNVYNHSLKKIFLFLTVMGCLLSVSGMYSLASLNVDRRAKEIGVRKVLGATIADIILVVNRQFALILFVAMIVGGAGGMFLTTALLNDLYVLHVAVQIVSVAACALVVFTLGISVTSGTIINAALANPRDSLRNE